MGYAPLPPPPRPGQPHVIRGRRQFLACVPDAKTLRIFGFPHGRPARLACEIEVRPYGRKWEWRVRMTLDGRGNPIAYRMGSWRRPGPYELRGRCRNQGDAWIRARAVVNAVRARHAELQVVEQRSHAERVPL